MKKDLTIGGIGNSLEKRRVGMMQGLKLLIFKTCSIAQYLAKKAARLRETSDINRGHYVSRIAFNLGYFTPKETKKCSTLVEGTLLDKKALRGFLDNGKMRIKENDVEEKKSFSKPKYKVSKKFYKTKEKNVRMEEIEKANEWRYAMLLKTGYQLDYALPILIHLGNISGYTFGSDYNPPMVPPYLYSTKFFTNMENAPKVDVEHVKESLNDEDVRDECGEDFEVGMSSITRTSMGNQEKDSLATIHSVWIAHIFVYSMIDAASEEMGEVDIENLTMEQYLALDHGDIRRGVRKPEIGGNVDFEIKGQFLRELRDNTFSRNENEDTYEHVGRILEVASLFNTPEVYGDAIML
nr:hypothetical protein [Tanacetum cinerariifolium]